MGYSTLMAGWASEDITPEKKVLLFGQFHERISDSVNDRIMATALAIESVEADGSKNQAVMISCDLVHSYMEVLDRLRSMLRNELDDLDISKIFTSAIHTHTAPTVLNSIYERFNWFEWEKLSRDAFMTPDEYMEFLLLKLKKIVIDAWRGRKASKVSWESGYAVIGHSRRVVYDDRSVMYGATNMINFKTFEGPSDHGVELMYFWDMDDRLTGVIVNIACPAQVVEMKNYISADYFGAARKKIKERISENIYVLPQIAPAGDQSPRDLIRRGKSEINMSDLEGMEELGSRVADVVLQKFESARKKAESSVVFKHKVEDVFLPLRKVTQGEVEWASKKYGELMKNYSSEAEVKGHDLISLTIYKAVLKRKEVQEKTAFYKMELHAIRLGDTAFATNPFELYIDYGLRIKARSKAIQTFTVQLSCDSAGYLPTERAVSGGSYGANVSNGLVGPEGGELLVEHTLKAVNSMWDEDDNTFTALYR